jgi:hypothetical protein
VWLACHLDQSGLGIVNNGNPPGKGSDHSGQSPARGATLVGGCQRSLTTSGLVQSLAWWWQTGSRQQGQLGPTCARSRRRDTRNIANRYTAIEMHGAACNHSGGLAVVNFAWSQRRWDGGGLTQKPNTRPRFDECTVSDQGQESRGKSAPQAIPSPTLSLVPTSTAGVALIVGQ